MLMESVSDPRRANWLTISMSEDICWPEENGANRPSWELEAEILRLTTRLMMREREARQTKTEMKSQAQSAEQQIVKWRKRMAEKERQMQLLLIQKDSEMQAIISQLLLFEGELRQEQNRIEKLLREKDSTIHRQQEEIKRLRSFIQTKALVVDHNHPMSDTENCEDSIDRRSMDSGLNLLDNESTSIYESTDDFSHRRRSHSKEPPTIDDDQLNATIFSTRIGHTEKELSVSASPLDNGISSLSNCHSDSRNGTTVVNIVQDSRVPYFLHSCRSHSPTIPNLDIRVPEKSDNSDMAVRKIKDGLIRIRAIQDLTNVRSRSPKIPELWTENIVGEKRRVPHKTPQKMKDLKAKRINVQHRNHRTELCGQVIL